MFGSKQWPTVEVKPAQFSADKFMTDLYSDHVKESSGEAGDTKGTWNDKNAKAAEPPKPGEGAGQPPTGKAAEPPPAKAGTKAGPKAGRTPADPSARTADGRTVGKLKEDAARKGKKPAAPEPGKGGTGRAQPRQPVPPDKKGTGAERHQQAATAGLAAVQAVTDRYARDGADKSEVVAGVKAVRRKFPVFKSIEVVDGGDTWDYDYVASPGTKKEGPPKQKPLPAPPLHPGMQVYMRLVAI